MSEWVANGVLGEGVEEGLDEAGVVAPDPDALPRHQVAPLHVEPLSRRRLQRQPFPPPRPGQGEGKGGIGTFSTMS